MYSAELVLNQEIKGFVHKIKRTKILSIEIDKLKTFYTCENGSGFFDYMIGKTFFLTREEAEKALEKIKK